MKTKVNIHFIYILLAAMLWGTAGVFVRTIESTAITEMQLVTLRALFCVITIGVVILFKNKKLFVIKLRDIWLFASSGIFSIVAFNYCYYKTMSLTSLSVAAVLLYTAPFFVVIMSVFLFRQRLTLKKCLACVVAFMGCCFVSGVFGNGHSIGGAAIFFGILTGFGYSLYTIFGRLMLDRGYHSLTMTFYTFVFAFVGCLFLINIPESVKTISQSPVGLMTAFLMAVINTVIPYILYTAGLTGVDTSTAPIIATVEPVVATIIGAVFYKEALTVWGVIGILMVLASILILNIKVGERFASSYGKGKCQNQSGACGNGETE